MAASPKITRVYWEAFKAPSTTISDIQEVQITFGRRLITDLLTAGTATISGRRPDLLPSLLIGDIVFLRMRYQYPGQPVGPDPQISFGFRVADVQIEYGTVASQDRWTIELEDGLAYLGRASLPTRTIASGTSTATAAFNIATDAGLLMTIIPGTTTATSAQTVTGQNAMDVFQNLVNTEAAWITTQSGDTLKWYPRNVWQDGIQYFEFSDEGDKIDYNDYRTASLADNYADKVVVNPRGSSEVIAGTGIFSYNLDSFSFDNAEALNLANFWKASLDVDFVTPRQISALVNDNNYLLPIMMQQDIVAGAKVRFRGSSSTSVVTGVQIFGRVDSTNVTLFLSSVNFLNYLVLDSTVYGYLDFNKLGW